MALPRLSVIIPTFNRRRQLAQVLTALDAQHLDPTQFEVIVVDDGSTDGTTEWLESKQFRFALTAKHQSNAGPATARNTAVMLAKGELVVFIDDDVVPMPELLQEHLASHEAESVNLAVTGPLSSLPYYEAPWVAWEQAKVEKQYVAMQRGDYAPTFRQFWTGNASVARSHVIAAGLFNTALHRAEDVDLGVRLIDQGIQFRFNAKARAFHHVDRTLASWSKTYASYGELEVGILSKLGDEYASETLAANYRGLRPEIRFVLRRCVGHPTRYRAVKEGLSAFLRTSAASRYRNVSLPVCSILANLLYWQASRQALGDQRYEEILRLAFDPS